MGSDAVKVPRTTHFEFGGPVGACFMLIGLPSAVIIINLWCSKDSCTLSTIPSFPTQISFFFDSTAIKLFLGWMAFQMFLSVLPTGEVHEGLPLRTGKNLKYRCNGFINFMVSVVGFIVLGYLGFPVHILYEKYYQLAATAIGFSFLLSIYLYARALVAKNEDLAAGGNSGNAVYDFFIGRELNPRIGPLDLKFFMELRPGLIGWTILNLSFIAESWRQNGSPDPAVVLVAAFEIFYVADALWFEPAILTTMDIIHDGFGFMLAFGDLTWVPFLYALNTKFLLEHQQEWSMLALLAIFIINLVGYSIFRGSNSQKNAFRQNPDDPKLQYLETMPTAAGKKLLISGWWGLCRHPNYLGDLVMALSWSLPCGMYILPYFYPIYFLCLLIHRNARDEVNCRAKYGADWDKYCQKVKYRIFPNIY